jgi:hypothetical protein
MNSTAQEAEKLKRQGHRVTLNMLVRTFDTPKYVAQEMVWRAPLKEKYDFWRGHFEERKQLRNALALTRWAEIRGLNDAAQDAIKLTQGMVSRDGVVSMGLPNAGARLHLADEVQDHRVFRTNAQAGQISGFPFLQWDLQDEFVAPVRPAYLILRTNARNESTGDCVLLD